MRSKSASAGASSTGIRAIQPIVYLARSVLEGHTISPAIPLIEDIVEVNTYLDVVEQATDCTRPA